MEIPSHLIGAADDRKWRKVEDGKRVGETIHNMVNNKI